MKKAQRTDLFREIIKSKNRYLSILFIVALGVAFYAGIRSSEPDMKISADHFYDETNFFDIRIVSPNGLTDEDLDKLKHIEGVKTAEGGYSAEMFIQSQENEYVTNVFSIGEDINKLTVKKGRLPENNKECFIDSVFMEENNYKIGDTITLKSGNSSIPTNAMLKQDTYTIVGYGTYAYYLNWGRGTASIGDGKVDYFLALPKDSFKSPVYMNIYVDIIGTTSVNCYSDEYKEKVNQVKERIEELGKKQEVPWHVLDRNTVETYVEFELDAKRIGAIGKVFPAIFFLVATLVSLTTMTRMVEEERIQIGMMKALGYGKGAIISKYLWYALSASLVGSIVGALAGSQILPGVILKAYCIMYVNIPEQLTPLNIPFSVIAIAIGVFCTVFATVAACYKELLASPAKLMHGVAPKQGKRVLLERIPFIWKHLNFTKKATVRNLIRYKKRFFMTVFGIGGCMALIMVGFGLRDSISQIVKNQYTTIWTYDAYLGIEESRENQLAKINSIMDSQKSIANKMYAYSIAKDVEANDIKKNAYLFIPQTEDGLDDFVVLKNRTTSEYYTLPDDGVIITEKLSRLLHLDIGDEITIHQDDTSRYITKVKAIAENYLQHYIYMSKEYYHTLTGNNIQYNQMYLKLKETDKEVLTNLSKTLLANDSIKTMTYVSELEKKIKDMMKSLDLVVWLLIISAGLLAFIVLYNLNNINIIERRRELATIKVLGFYNKELAGYVYRENVILTIVGIVVGIVLGIILHQFVIRTCEIDMLMFGRNINKISYFYSTVITIFFTIVVNVSMLFKLKKIDMVESLKNVE